LLFIRTNLLAILWSVIIIILCSIPGQEFPDTSFIDIPHLDKIVHFFLFFVLSVVTVKGLSNQKSIKTLASSPYVYTLIYAVCLGTIMEPVQHYFIAFRQGDVYDTLANISGATVGTLFIHYRLAPNYFLLNK
jgi:VanZ family protein